MPLYYVAVLFPFYFSGLVIGLLLTRSGSSANRLYAGDLVGAGLGCAAIALVMPQFGGSGSVLVSAAFGALAASAFTWHEARNWRLMGISSFGILVFLSFFAATLLPIKITVNKGAALKDFTPVYTAWNTFSKLIFTIFLRPFRKFPRVHRFVIDGGTAATGIIDLSKGIDKVLDEVRRDRAKRLNLTNMRAEVAALSKKNPKVLIIGSGAGDEIFESLIIGASSITAVELNPIIVNVQRDILKDQWGRMTDRPEVNLVVDEGRNFIKRSNEKYDVILSSHTISNAAVASGALSLAENYVLTREAFEDYLDHLTDDGVLYFTRPEIQVARLFTTATEMFFDRGIQSPGNHMFAYTEPSRRELKEKYKFSAAFVMKKSPLLETEVNDMESLLEIHTDTSVVARQMLYSPFGPNDENSIYHKIVNSKDLKSLYASNPIQLAPATDDKPFFNQHVPWSSISWEHFREIFTQNNRGRMALEDKPIAEITLVTILFQSLLIAAILILLPLWKFSRQGLQSKGKWNFLVYFAGLGLGFILIEIALLQKFNLYLGQPVYTYAVILASLLIFTGIGSYLSERFDQDARAIFTKLVPLILLVLLATALLLPFIFNVTLHFPLGLRVFISMILVAPLGIVLGMPFPLGLRLIGKEAGPLAPWAWGVNGFFTVIGSVSAIILGMAFGFTVVLATAAVS